MAGLKSFQERLELLIENLAGGRENRLAELLGIKPENVNKWTNRGSLPSSEQLENIASKLKINIHWLLTGEGEMTAPKTRPVGKKGAADKGAKSKKTYWGDVEVSLAEAGERLREIRGSLSLKQASEMSGAGKTAVKNSEDGLQAPDIQHLYWAAGYGHTNATWIMTGENPASERQAGEENRRYGQPITPEEREVLEMFRNAPKEAQESVRAILKIYRDVKR
ncbi:MAG: helix-turn-helix domain-containing protein [Nitrospinae bacterium]|nr:helix-turn-helix domain-containing protein [Nitrospinota bacterium]